MLAPVSSYATNGYFAHGYGQRGKGMGGADTALAIDAFGGASNPAGMVWVGNRIDVGATWFRPERSAQRVGSPAGVDFTEESSNNGFIIPEFGYNRAVTPYLALGVTIYGNGGMNTEYSSGASVGTCAALGLPPGPRNPLCGSGGLGVDLVQAIIAPTLAYKITPRHSVGIAPLFAYQRFAASGLQAFAPISAAPDRLTNNGHDDSIGAGVRVGWQGHLTDWLSLGAAYSTKIYTTRFERYRGLFAGQGSFDIPENFSVGAAFQATPALTISADYQRINYSDIAAVGNSSVTPGCAFNPPFGPGIGPGCLGQANGIGFGWRDVNVYKLGVQLRYNPRLTLRIGYDHTDNPIRPRDVTFNILAPGVVQDHFTMGFSYAITRRSELTFSYVHAVENAVSGRPNPLYFPVGGQETIRLEEDALGLAWSRRW